MKFAKRVCSSLSIPAFGRSRLERDRAGETELKRVVVPALHVRAQKCQLGRGLQPSDHRGKSKMAVMMFTLAVLLALFLPHFILLSSLSGGGGICS